MKKGQYLLYALLSVVVLFVVFRTVWGLKQQELSTYGPPEDSKKEIRLGTEPICLADMGRLIIGVDLKVGAIKNLPTVKPEQLEGVVLEVVSRRKYEDFGLMKTELEVRSELGTQLLRAFRSRFPGLDVQVVAIRELELSRRTGICRTASAKLRKVEFYTMNSLFLGARISIRDSSGRQVVWGTIPKVPLEFRGWLMASARETSISIPPDFDNTGGVDIVIHFTNSTASRYRIERLGSGEDEAIYLHVCGPGAEGTIGLRPTLYLNRAGGHYYPVTFRGSHSRADF